MEIVSAWKSLGQYCSVVVGRIAKIVANRVTNRVTSKVAGRVSDKVTSRVTERGILDHQRVTETYLPFGWNIPPGKIKKIALDNMSGKVEC